MKNLSPQPYQGPGTKNTQPIEKRDKPFLASSLKVHSIFLTVQGEGPFLGTPAVFIRLGGCNLQCPQCDTEYTLGTKVMPPQDIAYAALQESRGVARLAVITGGEPFRQNLTNLFWCLLDRGFYVQVETNGTLPPPTGEIRQRMSLNPHTKSGIYIVCSPKTGKVHEDIRCRACCFKYVLTSGAVDEVDGLPTSVLGLPNKPARPDWRSDGSWCQPVYVQPADEQDDERNRMNEQAAVESALAHGYIVQPQTHKVLNIE